MSEENTPPVSPKEAEVTDAVDLVPMDPSTVPAVVTKKKPTPKWLAATDLSQVVEIIAKCDSITPEEAVRRLNVMCEKGKLLIVPPFGMRK